jgi:C1A family cysteine protease
MNIQKRQGTWLLAAFLFLTLGSVVFAQNVGDDDDARRLKPYGPPGTAVPANATMIDNQQFLNLVQQGTISPTTLHPDDPGKDRQDRLDDLHEGAVKLYLRQHPELTNLAQLVASNPKSGNGLQARGDGTWSVFLPGLQSSIVTFGRSSNLNAIYNSIVFSGDRTANLALYTKLYNNLPGGYLESIDVSPVTPEQLVNASLVDIQRAISSLGRDWQAILPHVSIPLALTFTGCQGEIGAGSTNNPFQGDRALNQDACAPGSKGIYANFDFPNKSYNTCVKSQGGRGTCHTFAVTSATELQIALKYNQKVNLSEQDLMEHYRLLWQPALQQESGDGFELSTDIIATNYYQPYEDHWDYNPAINEYFKNGFLQNVCADYGSAEPCSNTAPEALIVCTRYTSQIISCGYIDAGISGSQYQISSATRLWDPKDTENSTEMMVLSLAFNNSVVLALNLTPGFAPAAGGYVPYSAATLTAASAGGHVVHVIGFIGNNELLQKLPNATPGSGGGYFIVKNSWSTCSGDGGYYYVPWDYVKARALDAFSIGGVN